MLTREVADRFVEEWVAAWNAHDVERIVAHWAEDCVFVSPNVARLLGEPSGAVRGKAALRDYWGRMLAAAPALRLEILGSFVGHDSLVIHFRNQNGQTRTEWIRFGPDGHAVQGAAHMA